MKFSYRCQVHAKKCIKALETYAFLTSSIFKGPVGGRPRIVLSERDPMAHESSSDSTSLGVSHLLALLFSQLERSLHSNPDVEFWKEDSCRDLKVQV